MSRSLGRSREERAGTTGAEKRPLSPDVVGATQASAAKRSRTHADLPAPTERRDNHGPHRTSGLGTYGPTLSRTEGIQTVTSSHSSAEPLGAKVVDVPNLPTLQGQPDEWAPAQIKGIKHTIETELAKKHGPVKVLGYHVTPERNAESLRVSYRARW
jgi:hypothetical protein